MKDGRSAMEIRVAPDVLSRLNRGRRETANLDEIMAVDFGKLMAAAFPHLRNVAVPQLIKVHHQEVTQRMAMAAHLLLRAGEDFRAVAKHESDIVRGWACYMIAFEPDIVMEEQLLRMTPLIEDDHFGVREWAWLAMKPVVTMQLEKAIGLLSFTAKEKSRRMRRFSIEVTRPIGVWCKPIRALRDSPELGMPILEPNRAEPDKGVRESLVKWLLDAAVDNPKWLRKLCERWLRELPDDQVLQANVQRALKELDKPRDAAVT